MYTKKITTAAIISCLAYLSALVFKVPVSFLSYEIKDVIIGLGAICIGGAYGVLISLVVSVIEMVTISDSGIIGLLTNFVSTVLYILPIWYMYNKNKSILQGVILGTLSMTIGMFLFNIIMTPLYLKTPLQETIHLLFTLITPFNIIKGAINGVIICLTYKHLLKALSKIGF